MGSTDLMLLLLAIQITVFTVVGLTIKLQRKLRKIRRPTEDRLLRAPGESLAQQAQVWNERALVGVMVFSIIPVVFSLPEKIPWQWKLAAASATMVICAVPIIYFLYKYRQLQLGLMGERAVGQQINLLMLQGFHVFHDYPGGPNWNIDHVIVGPTGVFAVETKARHKRGRLPKGKKDYVITYDGGTLAFPRGKCAKALDQARNQAKDLSEQLSKATAQPVTAMPILTYPGWKIERTGKGEVTVVNHKEIQTAVLNRKLPPLSKEQIQRIAFHLETKCADVVF